MKKIFLILIAPIFLLLTSCATIVGTDTQNVTVISNPSDADVLITDDRGVNVSQGKTPLSVTLKKSDGSYFGGIDYVLTVSKDGYSSQAVSLNTTPNGWYIGGNLLFGGLIGWLAVDPFSGKMYTLNPKEVSVSLMSDMRKTSNVKVTDKGKMIKIHLYEDLTDEMKGKLIEI